MTFFEELYNKILQPLFVKLFQTASLAINKITDLSVRRVINGRAVANAQSVIGKKVKNVFYFVNYSVDINA